ncbi:hypothetical protein AG1IA_04592 [Rhizoctonia solani AG-1 IA]|uniref:Golgi apparatus membrane protein TVP23 n=1 Tax=Thanatephorus cucumeris (strain AG1-IA) TaxID=983506 RepID=L8WYE9_THACA|nr:hypothetical protein AG1IA_04592 [Rhizoctonia solani AG-1 IA]
MSTTDPLLTTIEPDEVAPAENTSSTRNQPQREQVVLTPTNRAQGNASASDVEAGKLQACCLGLPILLRKCDANVCVCQSSHPTVLFFLYLFRIAAIAVYLLCGFFTDNYVLSVSDIDIVLLAMDFWNCRNVAGRRLVGLRFWNQVDEDGESYWVFESRDVGPQPFFVPAMNTQWAIHTAFTACSNPVLAGVLILGAWKASWLISHLIFFTHCSDRDAKQRWASSVAGDGWNMGLGGIGGRILGGAVRNSVGRAFGL